MIKTDTLHYVGKKRMSARYIKDINDAAFKAIDNHERLLHDKTLELLLGSMVARSGTEEVRKKLLWYIDKLEYF